jgi:hypothetical protein
MSPTDFNKKLKKPDSKYDTKYKKWVMDCLTRTAPVCR